LGGPLAAGVNLAPTMARAQALRIKDAKTTPSVCPYCSVGCATLVHSSEGKIVNIEGDPRSPHNEGCLCPKGAAIFQLHVNPNRPIKVMHRSPAATDWSGCVVSAWWRSRTRLEYDTAPVSPVWGLASDEATMYPRSMEDSDCIVIMGSNMAENHPVAFRWPMKAKIAHGAKLIHVDPRFTRTSAVADIYAPIRAGSDISRMSTIAIANWILRRVPPWRGRSMTWLAAGSPSDDALAGARSPSGLESTLVRPRRDAMREQ